MNRIRISTLTVLLLALSCGATLTPAVAWAQEDKEAEKLRLIEEMNRLAAKNAWSGVERSYEKLLTLRIDLPFDVHYLGAQSASYLGKTWERYQRLERAKAIDPQEEILSTMSAIDSTYGRVEIKGNPRKIANLTRAAMPFAPDERKSIEWAQKVVTETGSFAGMLPAGQYGFETCEASFDVRSATAAFQIVEVPKECQGKGETIVYAGPIAVVGGGYGITPLPGSDPGDNQAHPTKIGEVGLSLAVGGEVGFTKTFGVAATLGYNNLFGTDSVHMASGWLAAAIRPGDLRIAVGPQYSFLYLSGTGVSDYYFPGQIDEDAYPRDELQYKGTALGGGAQFSVGYGLMDFGSLQGVVELGGSWVTDGLRSYMNFGLRVGIVPEVPRFEG